MRKTIGEILYQPKAWTNTLDVFSRQKKEIIRYLEKHRNAELVATGCGTSYYLPLTACAQYTSFTAGKARGVPASEIMLFPQSVFAANHDYLLVPISRRGKTPETIAATRYVKEILGGGTLLISCTTDSETAKYADMTMVCPEAAEETKYMTRSFTSMLLGFQLLTAYKAGDKSYEQELFRLPEHGERLLQQYQPVMERLANTLDFNLYIYLGHGPLYGIAAESMLKIKEMACTPAEAYHGMELMHGPKYAVNDKTVIWYLLSDSVQKQEMELLKRVREWGGNLRVICEKANPDLLEITHNVSELNSGLSENVRYVLVMLLTQLYGYYRALALGKDIE